MLGLNVAGQHKHVESRKQPKNGVCEQMHRPDTLPAFGLQHSLGWTIGFKPKTVERTWTLHRSAVPSAWIDSPTARSRGCDVFGPCPPRLFTTTSAAQMEAAGIIDLRVAFLLVGDMGLRQHKTRLKVVNGSFYRNPRTAASI